MERGDVTFLLRKGLAVGCGFHGEWQERRRRLPVGVACEFHGEWQEQRRRRAVGTESGSPCFQGRKRRVGSRIDDKLPRLGL